jgi:hypothetical protein
VLLQEGRTCWRTAKAGRAALLIDMQAYFDAAMEAMSRAKHSVHLLNWAFEPQTLFHPQDGCTGPDSDRFGSGSAVRSAAPAGATASSPRYSPQSRILPGLLKASREVQEEGQHKRMLIERSTWFLHRQKGAVR